MITENLIVTFRLKSNHLKNVVK